MIPGMLGKSPEYSYLDAFAHYDDPGVLRGSCAPRGDSSYLAVMKHSKFAVILVLLVPAFILLIGSIYAHRYIKSEALIFLKDTVNQACRCNVAASDIEISLLHLTLTARGVHISAPSGETLTLQSIAVPIGGLNISGRQVLLGAIRLEGVRGSQLGKESITGKLIGHFTGEEERAPGSWSVQFSGLELMNGQFKQALEERYIELEGMNVSVRMNNAGHAVVEPRVRSISVAERASRGRSFAFSGLHMKLEFAPGKVEVSQVSVALKNSLLKARGILDEKLEEIIDASFDVEVDSHSIGLPRQIQFGVDSKGVMNGSLLNPIVYGSFETQKENPLNVELGGGKIVREAKLHGQYELKQSRQGLHASLKSFHLRAPDLQASLIEPLVVTEESLSGKAYLRVSNVQVSGIELSELNLELSLAGVLDRPELRFAGSLGSLGAGALEVNSLQIEGGLNKKHIRFEMFQEINDQSPLRLSADLGLTEPESRLGLSIAFKKFDLRGVLLPLRKKGEPIYISGNAKITGGASMGMLKGKGRYTIDLFDSSRPLSFIVGVSLDQGVLRAEIIENDNLSVAVTLDHEGVVKLTAAFDNLDLSAYLRDLQCGRLTGSLRYTVEDFMLYRGSGQLSVTQLDLGCQPHALKLLEAYTSDIEEGKIKLGPLRIGENKYTATLSGIVEFPGSFDIAVVGTLRLAHIAALAPQIDDARGKVTAQINVHGKDGSREISGSIELYRIGATLLEEGIELEGINGKGQVEENLITLTSITGKLNGGQLELDANLPLIDPLRGNVRLKLKEAVFTPEKNTHFVISSNLILSATEGGRSKLRGEVSIDSAEVSKSMRLRTVLAWFADLFYQAGPTRTTRTADLPVDIDLTLLSEGKMLLRSNFANLELKGRVGATGELLQPVFEGELEALSGEFLLRGHTFTLSSGSIYFESGFEDASIEAFGETLLFAGSLEETVIIAEISGLLNAPEIEFSSDRGLSQERIVQLLAGGDLFSAQTAIDILIDEVDLTELGLIDEDSANTVDSLIKETTTLDRLSVQPGFNSESGEADVTVIASKKVTDRVELVNENSMSALSASSKMKLNFAVNPRTTFSALADAPVTNRDTSFGFDLSYDLIPAENEFLSIEFEGDKVFRKDKIISALKLNRRSRVHPESVEQLRTQLVQFYREEGYQDAVVGGSCEEVQVFCRSLRFRIASGTAYLIDRVDLSGMPTVVPIDTLQLPEAGSIASRKNLEDSIKLVKKFLRDYGFLRARAKARYRTLKSDPYQRRLSISVRPRERTYLEFKGNSFFSNHVLLELIGLDKSDRSLGSNSIALLSKRIEDKYRQSGFTNVEVHLQSGKEAGGVSYLLSILEGERPRVKHVSFSGLDAFSRSELRTALKKRSDSYAKVVFHPEYVAPVHLKAAEKILREFYMERGFSAASVSSSFSLSKDRKNAEVHFAIVEGVQAAIDSIDVHGLPDNIEAPHLTQKPYSKVALKRYSAALKRELKRVGYRAALVRYEADSLSKRASFIVESGKATIIKAVTFKGNSAITQEILKKHILIKSGDRWDEREFSRNRRRLHRLGLFSHIEFAPEDGKIDSESESLVIHLNERPLQTASMGVGYDSEYGVHLFGTALDKSLFLDGRRLGVRADLFYDHEEKQMSKGLLSFRYYDPFFLNTRYRLTEDFRFQRLDAPSQEFELDRIALSSMLLRSLDNSLDYSIGHSISHENLADVSPDAILSDLDSGAFFLSSLLATISYDKRDNLLNARAGYKLGAGIELASAGIGSEANFIGLNSKASWIEPLELFESSFGVAINIEGAAAFEYADTTVVPISKRFYLGGRNSVRGFRENSLGPKGEEGSVLGGDLSLLSNLEFRYFPTKKWEVHTFFDAGNVSLRKRSFERLRRSAGAGFRYISPIGPAGFDLGFPLDERSGEPSVRLHFSIGMNF